MRVSERDKVSESERECVCERKRKKENKREIEKDSVFEQFQYFWNCFSRLSIN